MNKITRSKDLLVPKVTTGPISASSKVYSSPAGFSDVRVPFREIALSEGAGEKSFRVYDPSGPYTDTHATIDVEKGLPTPGAPLQFDTAGPKTYRAAVQAFGRSGVQAFGRSGSCSCSSFVDPDRLNARTPERCAYCSVMLLASICAVVMKPSNAFVTAKPT